MYACSLTRSPESKLCTGHIQILLHNFDFRGGSLI